jgi:threonine dehydratase
MRAFGAAVIEFGKDFDEAREKVEQLQAEQGLRYVHSANEPALIAGVGTYALEIFEAQPDTDVILVPIGGGSGACGCGIVRSGLGSRARVIGVQAARADAFTRSWRGAERVVGERADTFAEGMATRVTFDLPFGILKKELDDIVTLTEEDRAARDAQSRRGRRRRLADGGRQASRSTRRQEGRLRHERRQRRPGHAQEGPSVNRTVTVSRIETGSPFNTVGVKRHCRTASTAA